MPISRPPVSFKKPLNTSNLSVIVNAADIHIYLIVLQQVPASGFSTADICMHVFHHFFSTSYFPVEDKEADARSCIQNTNSFPYGRKVPKSAAAELYTVRAAIFIVEGLTVSCVAEC